MGLLPPALAATHALPGLQLPEELGPNEEPAGASPLLFDRDPICLAQAMLPQTRAAASLFPISQSSYYVLVAIASC